MQNRKMPAQQRSIKDLYIYPSIDELQQAAERVPEKTILGYRKMLECANKLYDKARLAYGEGDEELAYVYYMRCVKLYSDAKKCRDFDQKRDLVHWKSMCGKNVQTAVGNCESLITSLKRRYNLLGEINEARIKENEELEQLQNEQATFGRDRNKQRRDTVGRGDVTAAAAACDGHVTEENAGRSKQSIMCDDLYKLLQKKDVLVLDIRPEREYKASRIKNDLCLNIPPDICSTGLIASKIENQLNVGDRPTFRKRHNINHIVLLDWECTASEIERRDTKLRFLHDALVQYDYVRLKREPFVLEGGFQAFLFAYPSQTTNSKYTYEERISNGSSDDNRSPFAKKSLTSLLYPDVISIQNKSQLEKLSIKDRQDLKNLAQNRRPSIPDRKLKPGSKTSAVMDFKITADTKSSIDDGVDTCETANRMNAEMHEILNGIGRKFEEFAKFGKDGKFLDETTEYIRTRQPIEAGDFFTTNQELQNQDIDVLRKNYDDLKQLHESREKEYLVLQRQLELQKLRLIKPPTQSVASEIEEKSKITDQKGDEVEQLKSQLSEYKQKIEQLEKQNDYEQQQRPRIITKEENAAAESDKESDKENVVSAPEDSGVQPDTHTPAVTSWSSQARIKRVHSSPNIKKLLAEAGADDDQVIAAPTPPKIPDRSTKPKEGGMPGGNAAYTQETEYFYKSLRTVSGPVANVMPGVTGLRNLGNTCYMNSVIQCLSNTACLKDYFVNGLYKEDINYGNKLGSGGEVARSFAVLLASLWLGQRRYISPDNFRRTIRKVAVAFSTSEQQDAQEFLVFLLSALHEDVKRVWRRTEIPEQNNDDLSLDMAANQAWQNFLQNDRSIIIDKFYGQFVSHMKCTICSKASTTFEAFMSLTVPLIDNSNRCTLYDCLKKFQSVEYLAGESCVYCSRCDKSRETCKQMLIWKLPKILIIHFNRFKSVDMWREKANTFVDFPVFELNLSQYVYGKDSPYIYRLYGVVNHYGSMEGGHYTSFCRQGDTWYKYDDQDVSTISQGSVKTEAAYLLFYSAC